MQVRWNHIRRPRPSPRQRRRLGPPQAWNLFLLASNASMLRGSFDHFVVRAIELAVCLHSHSSLLFARLHMPKIPRGSFDHALWPQAFVVRALKPADCVQSPLLLGRSSLPFARLQTLKIPRGSFDQALWRQAFVVRALKLAVCLHGPLLLGRSSLPFARSTAAASTRHSGHGHLLLEP